MHTFCYFDCEPVLVIWCVKRNYLVIKIKIVAEIFQHSKNVHIKIMLILLL